jgi:hypothetical protein
MIEGGFADADDDVGHRRRGPCSAPRDAGRPRGNYVWSGMGFATRPVELQRLWDRIPDDTQVTVVLEPTRNAWVPLAAWFQARGATVVLVPSGQSKDLREYYSQAHQERQARLADPGAVAATAP